MIREPLTVRELLAEFQQLVASEPAAIDWPVVLAIDAEGIRGKPATSDTPVCTCGYLASGDSKVGDLTGEIDNCVVIWPAV